MSDGAKKPRIKIVEDGPYIVSGNVPLSEKIIVPNGKTNEYHEVRKFSLSEEYALCRCGKTKNPPFCDGSHMKARFDGTETASRKPYAERASLMKGPELSLLDDDRCAYARFCHREEGNVWELVEMSDDPHCRAEAIKAAVDCPTGRFTVMDTDGNVIEPELEPSIEILQDQSERVSGPLFVKGNIPIEAADGFTYEVRNRVALCRCGESREKPFCDAMHVSVHYKDHMK